MPRVHFPWLASYPHIQISILPFSARSAQDACSKSRTTPQERTRHHPHNHAGANTPTLDYRIPHPRSPHQTSKPRHEFKVAFSFPSLHTNHLHPMQPAFLLLPKRYPASAHMPRHCTTAFHIPAPHIRPQSRTSKSQSRFSFTPSVLATAILSPAETLTHAAAHTPPLHRRIPCCSPHRPLPRTSNAGADPFRSSPAFLPLRSLLFHLCNHPQQTAQAARRAHTNHPHLHRLTSPRGFSVQAARQIRYPSTISAAPSTAKTKPHTKLRNASATPATISAIPSLLAGYSFSSTGPP